MAEFVKVASVEDIPEGKMKSVRAGHTKVVVCHLKDGFFAVADECSHDYAPISTGQVKDDEIVCPRHGAKFDIRTGAVKAPPAVTGIDIFETKVEEGNIYVLVD